MIVKLLTDHHLEFLSLKGGCRGLSESTLVKIPHCWKSHALTSAKCTSFMKKLFDPDQSRQFVSQFLSSNLTSENEY